MKHWFLAIRPKTLFVGISPVLLGLAFVLGTKQELPYPQLGLLTLLIVICMQSLSNLANDYFDGKHGIDNSRQFGPERMTVTNKISDKAMKMAMGAVLLTAIMLTVPIIKQWGLPIIGLMLVVAPAALGYTAGPFPLSHYCLGELLAFIFFGPVAVAGTVFIQLGSVPPGCLVLSMIPGFLAALMMGINNMRDRHSDRKAGKWTLMNILPQNISLGILFSFLFAAILSVYCYHQTRPLPQMVLVGGLTLPLFFIKDWMRLVSLPYNATINETLAKTGLITFLLAIIISLGHLYVS